MPAMAIARRFRPTTFAEVIGQTAATRALENRIKSNRLHHAYLFAGTRGVGKTTCARILARSLNCESGPTVTPCGLCASCVELLKTGNSMDVVELDAASNTGIDNVREQILAEVNLQPMRDRFRIYIIDEAHQLSNAAFNSLLKTLEEPPDHVVFMMATTELHKFPETILSRCQVFEFRSISIELIYRQLREISDKLGATIGDPDLYRIARCGNGSMRDAESALDQVLAYCGDMADEADVTAALGLVETEFLHTTFETIASRDSAALLTLFGNVATLQADPQRIISEMISYARDLLITKVLGFNAGLLQISEREGERLTQIAALFSEADLLRFFSLLADGERAVRFASQPNFALELAVMKLLHANRLDELTALTERMGELMSMLEIDKGKVM